MADIPNTEVKQGVLSFDGEPVNIIRMATLYGEPWVFVYDISNNSRKAYKKSKEVSKLSIDTKKVKHTTEPLNPRVESKLIKYAKGNNKPKRSSYYRVEEALPIYFNVITAGTDTFDGTFGDGWNELAVSYSKGTPRLEQTGVFVALKRVGWVKSYIPLDGTIESLAMIISEAGVSM